MYNVIACSIIYESACVLLVLNTFMSILFHKQGTVECVIYLFFKVTAQPLHKICLYFFSCFWCIFQKQLIEAGHYSFLGDIANDKIILALHFSMKSKLLICLFTQMKININSDQLHQNLIFHFINSNCLKLYNFSCHIRFLCDIQYLCLSQFDLDMYYFFKVAAEC